MIIDYRQLERDEIPLFTHIDRTEFVSQIYEHKNGRLYKKKVDYEVPEWTAEQKEKFVQSIKALFDRGGIVMGAFDDGLLVGMATLDSRMMGSDGKQMNLNGLWVSHNYRRQGIAGTLINLIIDHAHKFGATSLYVSATESINTVTFYQNNGFLLAEQVDEILFEKEPKDIHLVKSI